MREMRIEMSVGRIGEGRGGSGCSTLLMMHSGLKGTREGVRNERIGLIIIQKKMRENKILFGLRRSTDNRRGWRTSDDEGRSEEEEK